MLKLITLPLGLCFETSFGVQTQRHIIVLTLHAEGREETIAGAWALLIPQVLGRS